MDRAAASVLTTCVCVLELLIFIVVIALSSSMYKKCDAQCVGYKTHDAQCIGYKTHDAYCIGNICYNQPYGAETTNASE